jgi:3-isopropylmalate/(R)-2-methylmalate dehydratase small subunit
MSFKSGVKNVLFLDRSDINTDEIIPARYLTESSRQALKPYLLEDLKLDGFDPKNDISGKGALVTRGNFGCGSSREHAPIVIKESGVSCVIAKSFARIFYRNAINIGLAILECPEAADGINAGDRVSVDFDTGLITDTTSGKTFSAKPFPPFIQAIISTGGLIPYLKQTQSEGANI